MLASGNELLKFHLHFEPFYNYAYLAIEATVSRRLLVDTEVF